MLLVIVGSIVVLVAVAIVVRGVWHIMYTYPHISEKPTWETYRLLTEAKAMEKLLFYVNETKMTHMLFPRNLDCKGSHSELNLPRYNSVLLSGDVFFLEHLLQQGRYQCGYLVSHNIERNMSFPAERNVTEAPTVDLNAVIKNCPDHLQHFPTLLSEAMTLLSPHDGSNQIDLQVTMQSFFDSSYGLSRAAIKSDCSKPTDDLLSKLLAAFRLELELLSKARCKRKYNTLLGLYLWGEEKAETDVNPIVRRLLDICIEIVQLSKKSIRKGTLWAHLLENDKLSSADLCDALQLLCQNSDRLASTTQWFFKEVLGNPMHIHGLQSDVDALVSKYGPDFMLSTDFCDKLKDMGYFNNCILEVVRMWPTLSNGLSFKILQDTTFDEELICKESDIVIPYFSLFRQLWIDSPDVYTPHRWHDSHHQYHALKSAFSVAWGEKQESSVPSFQSVELARLRMVLFRMIYMFDIDFTSMGNPHCVDTLMLQGARVRIRRRQRDALNSEEN